MLNNNTKRVDKRANSAATLSKQSFGAVSIRSSFLPQHMSAICMHISKIFYAIYSIKSPIISVRGIFVLVKLKLYYSPLCIIPVDIFQYS